MSAGKWRPQRGKCAGCGIDINDGYCIDCKSCQTRRFFRKRRGQALTPTIHYGEWIDNNDPKGRIVVHFEDEVA
jgi:hypothetical protein